MAGIINIGNTLKLRDEIDAGQKVTKWFQQGLNVVDIMPAAFSLDFQKNETDSPFKMYNVGGDRDPIAEYGKRCKEYGLPSQPEMLRLWLTGDSTFQEELSSSYQTNMVESLTNSISSKISGFKNIGVARDITAGAGGDLLSNVKSAIASNVGPIGEEKKATESDAINSVLSAAKTIGDTLTKTVLGYNFLSAPKTYTGTNYSPSLNFNVRLISPYGHPDAIQKFIVDPLTHLLLLSSPITTDGLTYGGASYVTVKAYGITDIDLGIIENISIKRGGNDVAYNKYRQPLSVDLNLSIKPAADGFAIQMPSREKQRVSEISSITTGTRIGSNHKGIALDIINEPVKIKKGKSSKASMSTMSNILESFRPNAAPDKMDNIPNTKLPVNVSAPTGSIDQQMDTMKNAAAAITGGLQAFGNAVSANNKPAATSTPTQAGALISNSKTQSRQAMANATASILTAADTIDQGVIAVQSGDTVGGTKTIDNATAKAVADIQSYDAANTTAINNAKSANGGTVPSEMGSTVQKDTTGTAMQKHAMQRRLQAMIDNAQGDATLVAKLQAAKSNITNATNNLINNSHGALATSPTALDFNKGSTVLLLADNTTSAIDTNVDSINNEVAGSSSSTSRANIDIAKANISNSANSVVSTMNTSAADLSSALSAPVTDMGAMSANSFWDSTISHLEQTQAQANENISLSSTPPNLEVATQSGVSFQDMITQCQQIAANSIDAIGANI